MLKKDKGKKTSQIDLRYQQSHLEA